VLFDVLLKMIISTGIFLLSFIAATVVSALLWGQFIVNAIYTTISASSLDYILFYWAAPYNYIHVKEVKYDPTAFYGPDQLLINWHLHHLWMIWCLLVALSITVSLYTVSRVNKRLRNNQKTINNI
jgi:hypothetical protein